MCFEDFTLSDGSSWSYTNGKKEKQINQFVQIDTIEEKNYRPGACLIDHISQKKQAVRLGFGSFCSLLTRASNKLAITVEPVFS